METGLKAASTVFLLLSAAVFGIISALNIYIVIAYQHPDGNAARIFLSILVAPLLAFCLSIILPYRFMKMGHAGYALATSVLFSVLAMPAAYYETLLVSGY